MAHYYWNLTLTIFQRIEQISLLKDFVSNNLRFSFDSFCQKLSDILFFRQLLVYCMPDNLFIYSLYENQAYQILC